MQGEMSATVFYYPGSYVKLIPDLKQRLATGQAPASNIRIGVSTNFDKLCGCVLQACPCPYQLFTGLLAARWDAFRQPVVAFNPACKG